jgi:hypothetical protein
MPANEPGNGAQTQGNPSSEPRPLPSRRRARLRGFGIDLIATGIVSAVGLAILTFVGVANASVVGFQEKLFESVGAATPLALLDYILGDLAGYAFAPVRGAADALIGAVGGLIGWIETTFDLSPGFRPLLYLIASPLVLVFVLVELAIVFIVLGLAVALMPIALPFAVLVKGSAFDAVVMLVVFVPAMWLVIRTVTHADFGGSVALRFGLYWYGTVLALMIMTVFYYFVQLIMIAADWALGVELPTAPTWVWLWAVGIFVIKCVGKTVESSITNEVARKVRRQLRARRARLRP